ncbi:MAG: DUF4136 domain-containing protein [Flammeovirgaceae bacterium]|nr:MAG: DUF4136 domain-containing protein [Flammeovirgaceae bacterium]
MNKVIGILGLLIFFACDPVKTEYKSGIDFSIYKTFCWLENCSFFYTGPEYLNRPEIQEAIRKSIIDNLSGKGLRFDSNNPDLLVDFHVTIEDTIVIRYHSQEDEPYYYKTPFTRADEIHVTKGTLVVHLIDRQRGELVWESHTEGFLETPPDLSEKHIRAGINKVLQDFPPKPKE